MENLDLLIKELIKLPNETEWLEFKHDNYTPEMIGKDISALANSATLSEKNSAYMIWGVHDETHDIVGTKYDLQTLKKGNQEIGNWLRSLLSKNVDFEFQTVEMKGTSGIVKVGVLIIYKATNQPVMFEKVEYIRIGSYTKTLNEYPSIKTKLWNKLQNSKFEDAHAKEGLELNEALALLDYTTYFDIKGEPQPTESQGMYHRTRRTEG